MHHCSVLQCPETAPPEDHRRGRLPGRVKQRADEELAKLYKERQVARDAVDKHPNRVGLLASQVGRLQPGAGLAPTRSVRAELPVRPATYPSISRIHSAAGSPSDVATDRCPPPGSGPAEELSDLPLPCVVDGSDDSQEEAAMAEGHENKDTHFMQPNDPDGEFSERGDKGLDSPRGPRPQPRITPAAAAPQNDGSAPVASGNASPATSQQDPGGPVDYNG